LNEPYIPAVIHVPLISKNASRSKSCSQERRGRKVEINTPQRGQKRAMMDLAESNAKHSFEQRFRVLKPSSDAIQTALQDALGLRTRPTVSSVLTFRTFRAPTKSRAWWCGKTER
jgi:excinuclease ABC subunit C